jgi:hypothetical protein
LPLLLLVGCAWQDQSVSVPSFLQRSRSAALQGPYAVFNVTEIERPIGDEYINRDLWDYADEMVVADLERRAVLDDNGLRVGQLVGSPPQGFQELLLSPRYNGNSQVQILAPNWTKALVLGPILDRSSYQLVRGTQKTSVCLDRARYFLEVKPALTHDGLTRLTFTPKVEHGEPQLPFEPMPEEGAWGYRLEPANHKYPELSWEVTLAPDQYLIVGGRLDRPSSLGHCAFVQEEGRGVQRLLVIRGWKAVAPPSEGSVEDCLQAACAPLALQATVGPIARAQKH